MSKTVNMIDPKGINNNPLTNEPYSDTYRKFAEKWSNYPAYNRINDIIKTIDKCQVTLIISGTGSGKTVLIPKIALHVFDYNKKIAITLPKQITAKSAAVHAAETLDVKLGAHVGYQYKGSDKKGRSKETKLLYATDGTIVSKLLRDPVLSEYSCVIIDEAHERKVQIDFLLYLLKNAISKRKDLKVIIMSATVNESIFSDYFKDNNFGSLNVGEVTNYPIKSIFLSEGITTREYMDKGYEILKKILNESNEGDIIFFVPSVADTMEFCKKTSRDKLDLYCIEVYSGMHKDKEEIALDVSKYKIYGNKSRKLIMATAVAESSLTFPNIRYVIDSGLEFSEYYDPQKEVRTLEKKMITNAQARQRMGRAGRTQAGTCYHLYTKEEFDKGMKRYPEPSIRTSNIYQECLKLLNYPNIVTISKLKEIFTEFIEPPSDIYINSAIKQLQKLKLADDDKITEFGKIISDIQFDPTIAIALYSGCITKCSKEILAIYSLLEASKKSIGDVFIKPDMANKSEQVKFKENKKKLAHKSGDHISLYNIFNKYIKIKKEKPEKLNKFVRDNYLKQSTLDKAYKIYKSYKKSLKLKCLSFEETTKITDYKLKHRILSCIGYGFSTNQAYLRVNDYKTPKLFNIKIHRDTFIDKYPSKITYNELFSSMPGKVDITIASNISNSKVEELMSLIDEKINSINK